jgi:hypothetical protein
MIFPLAMQITSEHPEDAFSVDSHWDLRSVTAHRTWKIRMTLYDTETQNAWTYEMEHMRTTSIEPAMRTSMFAIDGLEETDRKYLMTVRDRLNQLFPENHEHS